MSNQIKDKLYQEELMEHFKNPCNYGSLKNPDFVISQDVPSCGDVIAMEGKISQDKLEEISFSGNGCVLSMATASMLTQRCKGCKIKEILALCKEDVLKMVGLELGPNRLKCALLSLQVLKEGINSYIKKN
jgi:nitrogen fixation protein NifU and related proteins